MARKRKNSSKGYLIFIAILAFIAFAAWSYHEKYTDDPENPLTVKISSLKERVNTAIGENPILQSLKSQTVNQGESQNVNQGESQNVNQGESQNVSQNVNQDENQNQSQNVSQDENQQQEERKNSDKTSSEDDYILLPRGLELPLCKKNDPDHQIRRFDNYTICYRESYEQAEWSAYSLSREQLKKNASRSNDFRPDPQISSESASLADYKGSGFDRGHLTPAADMSFDQKAMSETFFMSNMSPQAPEFNRGIWKDLEAQVRLWTEAFGKVYVVSGPILEKSPEAYKSIGKNNVTVPEFYYKVILAPVYESQEDAQSPEDAKSLIALAFIFPNKKCQSSLMNYAVTVNEVEERTGLNFFSLLEDQVEEDVESQVKIQYWK